MSKLSDILKLDELSQDEKDAFRTCLFCGEKIDRGGGWACAEISVGVCENHAYRLIDFYIDAISDTGTLNAMSYNEQKKKILNEVEARIKYKNHLYMKHYVKDAFMKLGMRYYAVFPPMDYFALIMTKDEFVAKLKKHPLELGAENIEDSYQYVDICEMAIIDIIERETGEKPHTIRYFAFPNLSAYGFYMGCAAKIYNNGSTYVFMNDYRMLEVLGTDDHNEIKDIINEL